MKNTFNIILNMILAYFFPKKSLGQSHICLMNEEISKNVYNANLILSNVVFVLVYQLSFSNLSQIQGKMWPLIMKTFCMSLVDC